MLTPRDVGILREGAPFLGVSDFWETEDFSDDIRSEYFDEAEGTLAATLDTLSLTASGNAIAKGALAATLDTLSLTASGNAISKGALAATLDAPGLSAGGAVHVQGTLAATLDGLSLDATGTSPITGQLAVTLDSLTLTAHDPAAKPYRLRPSFATRTVRRAATVAQIVVARTTIR